MTGACKCATTTCRKSLMQEKLSDWKDAQIWSSCYADWHVRYDRAACCWIVKELAAFIRSIAVWVGPRLRLRIGFTVSVRQVHISTDASTQSTLAVFCPLVGELYRLRKTAILSSKSYTSYNRHMNVLGSPKWARCCLKPPNLGQLYLVTDSKASPMM